MNLVYFIPEHTTPTINLAELVAAGLGYAFDPDTPRLARPVVGSGPDGNNPGVIVSASAELNGVGYYPQRQTWRTVPGTKVWVGHNTDALPTPAELARRNLLAGHPVRLGDGQLWQVPVTRGYEERAGQLHPCGKLPWRTRVDESGQWRSELAEQYRALWDTACAFWDSFTASGEAEADANGAADASNELAEAGIAMDAEPGGDAGPAAPAVRFDFAGANDAALLALAANYRIGKAEVDLLGLFNQQAVTNVLLALVDWPTLQAFAATKAAPAGSPT